jgi:hypothetical protein
MIYIDLTLMAPEKCQNLTDKMSLIVRGVRNFPFGINYAKRTDRK